ncbi:opine metallophore biosynthesis dehydrogenase [Staphylococcus sp. GSSP0090]|nr:opine metallophore biosynthesis dehydrogenase [Staphylococcus sp. GSSP0090]
MSNILIAGTGPVAVQLAKIFTEMQCARVSMVGRAQSSVKSQHFYQCYQRTPRLKVTVQNDDHRQLAGQFELQHMYADYQDLHHQNEGSYQYDTLIMACNAEAYRSILAQLPQALLKRLAHIVLVSPTIGSHMIVQQQLRSMHVDAEVIVFSTYIGDTRVLDKASPQHVMTAGVKSKVYISSMKQDSKMLSTIIDLFESLNIQLIAVASPLLAESRNSSLYVHPPLFMNDFSLNTILNGSTVPVYVYKLFPEGPITMQLIAEMRALWQEINLILKKLETAPLNLLKFMVRENYPVRDETMSEQDIERFEGLAKVHQEYLLYVRYSAILIDPFSKPDAEGRYFDFSAVPFKQIYQNEQGVMQIPRMPYEDYYRTTIIQQLGRHLLVKTPTIDNLLHRYETHISNFVKTHTELNFSNQFELQNFEHDTRLITQYLKNNCTLNKI